MTSLVTLDDYERAAQPVFAPAAWEYVHGGAADELTLRRNRDAFNAIQLAPRVLNEPGPGPRAQPAVRPAEPGVGR